MPALRDYQQRLVDAVLRRSDDHGFAVAGGMPADTRVGIYRANARENFTRALMDGFPLLLALVGEAPFRALAWQHQQACPSSSGNLAAVGERLAAFLAAQDGVIADGTPRLADVAQLEWAVQEALGAAECAAALDPGQLAALSEDAQQNLRFSLHPSVRLVGPVDPLFERWRALKGGIAPPAIPAGGSEWLLVRRGPEGIVLHRLAPLDARVIGGLLGGLSLGDLAEALEPDEAPSLGDVLARWVREGAVVGFRMGAGLS